MAYLRELAQVIRTKNAGPFTLSADIIFGDAETYESVKRSGAMTRASLARLYGVSQSEISEPIYFDPGRAIKVNIRRAVVSGDVGDPDVLGSQQHAPLLNLVIPGIAPPPRGAGEPRGLEDRFGNSIDPSVGYARGAVLGSSADEVSRMLHGRTLIRERLARLGRRGVFNLTGLIRGCPMSAADLEGLRSLIEFYGAFPTGEAEAVAVRLMGGRPGTHEGLLCNRVSAAMLAVMLGTVRRGERVLSVVPGGRSHPSVERAVGLAGATFIEVEGVDAALDRLGSGAPWRMVVVTTLTPSKHHLPADQVCRVIERARPTGSLVFLDDAHMASRMAFFDEPPSFGIGDADLSVWSLDKHVPGPRAGAVVGRADLMAAVRARAFELGLEAQASHYVSALRALERVDLAEVRQAGALARSVHEAFRREISAKAYLAGPGVAIGADDFAGLIMERAGCASSPLVPIELVAAAAMWMLEQEGAVTIPAIGMPGSAPTFRMMTYPDGARLGVEGFVRAASDAISRVVESAKDPARIRRAILGA